MITDFLGPSPRQSPAVSLMHASPAVRQNRGDLTPQANAYDSSYFIAPTQRQEEGYGPESVRLKTGEKQQRKLRSSGPLEYSSSRKVKFVEGSSSGGQGPSPLPRFAVSRSGPLLYK